MKNISPKLGAIIESKEIGLKGHNKLIWAACERCGKERWSQLIHGAPQDKLCLKCAIKEAGRLGDKSPTWEGGRFINSQGYILVWISKEDFFSSMRNASNHVLEHRLVMAKHLKRCLLPWEIVHHKNGIKTDNRIENLELISSDIKHNTITKLSTYIKKLEKRNEELEQEVRLLRKTR